MNRMRRVLLGGLIALAFPLLLAPRGQADLAAYLARPEPAFRWEKRSEKRIPGGTIHDLELVSQTWQGSPWRHRLRVFRPDNLKYPGFCGLLNTGGSGSEREEAPTMALANAAGTVFAILYDIPNQPLYGKKEDALIVYTWQRYLETGDATWPLHFPMAKSVLKAMDAIQAFTEESGQPPIEGFLVTGASKRGWTAWLVGASGDPRVRAIAPMVIDILNIPAQIPHQVAAFGKPSEQVADYTAASMEKILLTPNGRRLLDLTDPYSYRDRLTLPKLIILGTNDRYWSQDALNLYWDGLKGPKWVQYVPNSGHGLEDRARVYGTLAAFLRATAADRPMPQPRWTYREESGGVRLTVGSDLPIRAARLFRAHAPTLDLRDARWTSEPMTRSDGGGYTARIAAPAEGRTAVYGELTYDLDGRPFTLTTQIRILGGGKSQASREP